MEKQNAIELIDEILSAIQDSDECKLDDEYIELILGVAKTLDNQFNDGKEEARKIFADLAEEFGANSLLLIALILLRKQFEIQENTIARQEKIITNLEEITTLHKEVIKIQESIISTYEKE